MRTWTAFVAGMAVAALAAYVWTKRENFRAPSPPEAAPLAAPAAPEVSKATPAGAPEPAPPPPVSRPRRKVAPSWTPPQQSAPAPQQRAAALPEPPAPEPAGSSAPAPALAEPAPPPPPPEPNRVTLLPGTLITVRLNERVSSDRHGPGDAFRAVLDEPLIVDGFVIAERGARVEGKVTAVNEAGRVKGTASLALELVSLQTSDGQRVEISTDPFERKAPPTRASDAAKVGVGAALGAAIGAIAGGGKGAAVGAGAGGAAGAGTVLATRGRPAELAAETRISFRLNRAVTIVEKR
jgi:hypothetical protein